MQVSPTDIALWTSAWTAVGWLAGHWLTGVRDKSSRKRAFIGFLEKWKAEITAPSRGPTSIGVVTHPSIKAYDARVCEFRERVEIVRDAFNSANKFQALAARLANLKTDDWQGNKQPREVILEALDALLEFTHKTPPVTH